MCKKKSTSDSLLNIQLYTIAAPFKMEIRQRSALRRAHRELASDIFLEEKFYSALIERGIFTKSMIALIKVMSYTVPLYRGVLSSS